MTEGFSTGISGKIPEKISRGIPEGIPKTILRGIATANRGKNDAEIESEFDHCVEASWFFS